MLSIKDNLYNQWNIFHRQETYFTRKGTNLKNSELISLGIYNGCKIKCKVLISNTPEENECYNECFDQDDTKESIYTSGYKLRERPIQQMKSCVASGKKNIVTVAGMKTALDSGTGVAGCQVSEYVIDTSKHKLITQKLKGINDFNELQFEEDGILLRKAYNIGKGKFIPNESLDQMERSDQMLFYCTVVGCVKRFATLNGLENHLLIGRHFLQLQRETIYDKIRHQWARLCNEVVFTTKNKSTSTDGTEKEFSTNNMGWAIKKGKRISSFPDSVKNFQLAKFEEGNRTGKKGNPAAVAEEMKKIKNSNGKKMFPINHWLNAGQITSYLSRLCS
ncbi:unnamed protein product [Mytilus coruscus]|uniref:C2H2-type domain-containing protein n=1 Tax=Mytilus coruscus TaxID=42192 RepID=A0A6J8DZY4_MYTCO|nr:unnamed protein product [Mytilus coruscus]